MSGRSSEQIPTHLRSTVDLLARAFDGEIAEHDYLPLLALLGEHMCEENLSSAVALCFARDRHEVANDLAKAHSTHVPSVEAVASVRARLERAGLTEWLVEDEEIEQPRGIRLPEEETWRIYLLLGEMVRFFHQPMHYPSIEHVHRWLEHGVFDELSELYYRVVAPSFPVDDATGLVRGPGGILHGDEPFVPSRRVVARKELREAMMELSERAMASQWYADLEHILWDRIGRGQSRLGSVVLSDATLARLLELSQEAGGWFHFSEDAEESTGECLVFEHADEWEHIHAEWLERVPESARPRDR